MAYDEGLANQLRELLADEDGITEKKMFGGLGFLVNGNMTVAASHTGGLLARIDPQQTDDALAQPGAAPMEMRGRTMDGWITVDRAALDDEGAVESWVDRSLAYVRTLPAK